MPVPDILVENSTLDITGGTLSVTNLRMNGSVTFSGTDGFNATNFYTNPGVSPSTATTLTSLTLQAGETYTTTYMGVVGSTTATHASQQADLSIQSSASGSYAYWNTLTQSLVFLGSTGSVSDMNSSGGFPVLVRTNDITTSPTLTNTVNWLELFNPGIVGRAWVDG
jgi:hypothetical protein